MASRCLLAPDPLGLTPSAQRRLGGHSKQWLRSWVAGVVEEKREKKFRQKQRETCITQLVDDMFAANTSKPQKRPHMATRRRKKGNATAATNAVENLIESAPAQKEERTWTIPEMSPAFTGIREKVFEEPDPQGTYRELEEALKLTQALTPGNLQAALNDAEDNARKAHKLYVCARADYEAFEREMDAVSEGMRDAANKELQAEKDQKLRSKAITDADVRGRAAVLFPDEWKAASDRRVRAEGMLDHLKAFAELWKNRCYSLNGMLNAGKRS